MSTDITVEEYKKVVGQRYAALSDEEKTIAESAADSPVGDVLRKLFGPEMSGIMSAEPTQPAAQPMASQPQPMTEQMQRAGLGAR